MGTARRGSVKAGAVVLAAFLGVLAPAAAPLAAAGQPAGEDAQEPWEARGKIDGPPNDSGGPDPKKPSEKKVECIQPESKQHATVKGNILKDAPWGQAHLRLSEVHEYIKARTGQDQVGVSGKNPKKRLRVAVIDTGVYEHPFFQNRVKAGGDYVQKDGNGLEDCDGHGTQVAGIIAGNPQDPVNIGFIGVAPDAQVIAIRQSSQNYQPLSDDEIQQRKDAAAAEKKQAAEKAKAEAEAAKQQAQLEKIEQENEELKKKQQEDDDGDTGSSQEGGHDSRAQDEPAGVGDLNTLSQAIVRAVDEHKVDVINMSVDACRPNDGSYLPTPDEAKVRAAVHYAVEKNVVVVVAAGNAGGGCVQNDVPPPASPGNQGAGAPQIPDPDAPPTVVTPPWFSDDLLSVGAIDKNGSVAGFSMRGPWLSVAAPGTEIISLDPAEGSSDLVNLTFEKDKAVPLQGTSFAAPYVAGLALLIRQVHPDLTARQIMERIKATAQHPGAHGGHDQFVGYGVIDPMAALTATLPSDIGQPPAENAALGSGMPPLIEPDNTPMIVALAGSAGGLLALAVTMFVVRTVRRRQDEGAES